MENKLSMAWSSYMTMLETAGIRLAIVWHCAWLAMVSGRCLVTGPGGMAGFYVHVFARV